MTTEEHAKPIADSRPKAVIFTNFGGLRYGNDRREFEAHRTAHLDYYKQIIGTYLQCNAESDRIAIVFAYVNWAFQQEVVALSGNRDQDNENSFTIDAKLLRQEAALIDLLRMAEHQARKELGLSRATAPIFHYVGIRHLLDLLNNLIEVDPTLVNFLSGQGGIFTYDSPKFVEAVIRLARGAHAPLTKHPVIRIDEDAQINASAINLLLDEYEEISSQPRYFFFSGTYGSPPSFKITEQSLVHPNPNDIPTDILEKLKALTRDEFEREEVFLRALRPILGDEQTDRYKSSLLKNFQYFKTFKITDQSLAILRSEGVPDEILKKLANVNGLLFQDEEELIGELRGTTVNEQVEKYRSSILKCASVQDGNYDPVNDHAVRVHWFSDTRSQGANVELITKFLADLNETGATQALNSPPQILNSAGAYSLALQSVLSAGRPGTQPRRTQPQVISGAGLTMSTTAIRRLPPFMNFKNLTIWVDDHLKRRLHEAIEHLPSGDRECLTDAKIKQDRHPKRIEIGDLSWARTDYLDRLLRGCLSLRLITDLDGRPTEYSKLIGAIVRSRERDATNLRREMMLHAQERYDEVLRCWQSPEFMNTASFDWAKSRSPRGFKLTAKSLNALRSEGISQLTLDKLNTIKNKVFKDERLFTVYLESVVGDEQTPEHQLLILKHAQFPERFKITDEFLRTMESEGLPKELIRKLRKKRNEEFEAKSKFISGIRAIIGDEQTDKYESLIVKCAKQSAHRQQTCADVVQDAMNYIELVRRWHIFVAAIEGLPPEGNYWLFDLVD